MALCLLDGAGGMTPAVRPKGLQPLPTNSEDGEAGIILILMIAIVPTAAHAGSRHLFHVGHARHGDAPILPLAGTLGLETELPRQGVEELALGVGQVGGHGEAVPRMVFSEIDQQLREADAVGFRYRVDVGALLAVDELGLGCAAAAAAAAASRRRGVSAAGRSSASGAWAGRRVGTGTATAASAFASSTAAAASTASASTPALTAHCATEIPLLDCRLITRQIHQAPAVGRSIMCHVAWPVLV